MKTILCLITICTFNIAGAIPFDGKFYFTNTAPIIINDSTNPPTLASPYPSVINASGLTNLIDSVSVTLSNVSHTFPDDIAVLLVGPQGQAVALMANAGGDNDLTNGTVIFSAFGSDFVGPAGPLTPGTYKPSLYGDPFWPAPAPGKPYGNDLSVFHGTSANGAWKLFVYDDEGGDSGIISNGWRLTITTSQNPAPMLSNVSVDSQIFENAIATLSGKIVEANPAVGFALSVNWGDGSTNQNLSFPAGSTNFLLTHRYIDDGQKGTPSENCKVVLTLADNVGVSDAGFLSAIFNDLLGHPCDPEQRVGYLSKISQVGRSNFAYDMLTSLEYRVRKVQEYYQQFLHHPASQNDQDFYAQSALEERTIVLFTLVGADYFQVRATNNNSAWLDSLYYDLLKRQPTAAEKNSALSVIAQNGRPTVADTLLNTEEFRQLQVESWFQKYFHRTGGADALPYVNGLSGQSWETVLALMLGSADYYNGRSGGTACATLNVTVNNAAPIFTYLGIGSPIVEGGITSVSGQFVGLGTKDNHTLKIDWGDGTSQNTWMGFALNSFNESHMYTTPNKTNNVQLTLSDDDGGVIVTNLAVLVKEMQPIITGIARQPGSITRLECKGVPLRTYTVQASGNLSSPTNWVNIGGATALANGTFTNYDMSSPNASARFYRLRSP